MPCLNLSTNASLEGVDTSSILKEATTTVAKLIGKPEAVLSLSSGYNSICISCSRHFLFLLFTIVIIDPFVFVVRYPFPWVLSCFQLFHFYEKGSIMG